MARLAALIVALVLVTSACSKREDTAAPVAKVTVHALERQVAPGAPVEVDYRFEPRAPGSLSAATNDDWVFVHLLDDSGALLWTDDHQPPMGWRADGLTYRRTMFVPRSVTDGTVHIQVGVYAPKDGKRLRLEGSERGGRSYDVDTLAVKTRSTGVFVVFGDGWHGAEQEPTEPLRSWRWSKGTARLTFRNLNADATLWLELDQPIAQVGMQQVEVRAGSESIGTLTVAPGGRRIERIEIPAAKVAGHETVDLDLAVQPTFVPAAIAALGSQDTRELGIRVYNAYVKAR